jgi:hypothetical protein
MLHPPKQRPELDVLIEKSRTPPESAILGLAGDGTKIVLWLKTLDTGVTKTYLEKEMGPYEAINLARRLLIEATPLLKRGV